MRLTSQQLAWIDTFGYMVFPGLLADRIDAITAEFEGVFARHGGGHDHKPHDGSARSCIVPFVDQSAALAGLLDDPRVDGIHASLLGDDYNYLGSDGNFYVGDTGWHSDTDWTGRTRGTPPRVFYKMALYLDPVTRDTGALRVIPGSHRWGDVFAESLERALPMARDVLGSAGDAIPAVALESRPGDVVIFNQNLKHSSWGGGRRRRMFTINTTSHYADADLPLLRNEISGFARFWITSVYGEAMTRGAPASRMVHLRQALDNEGHLAEEVQKAKGTMKEPSRG